jgi:O-antigen biosynthesis protein WbqP
MKLKRSLDFLLAVFFLAVFSPIFLIIAILIKISSPGPVLYASKRVGKAGATFKMYKFRTMKNEAPIVATHLLKDPYTWITPLGIYLRKSSLDELPQLFNILMGEMSFVGPRPALFNQFDLLGLRRGTGVDALVPGLTGWAQVNGRDELGDSEKVKLDLDYLNRRSITFDIYILWLTFIKVLNKNGISH